MLILFFIFITLRVIIVGWANDQLTGQTYKVNSGEHFAFFSKKSLSLNNLTWINTHLSYEMAELK